MEGMGGMGGMGGRRARKVDNDKYYEILGVPKNAQPSQIKKAYRKKAMTHHPDKGGDKDTFQQIQTAFDVLGDEEKRQIYDEYGEEGLRDGGGPGDAHDFFASMFGGAGMGPRGPRKGENVVHSLRVTLEDLYKGKMSKLAIIRNRVCPTCFGVGATSRAAVKTCMACNGSGVQVTLKQIGPGMVQQVQSTCRVCGGKGYTIADKDKCRTCNGEKVIKERKVLEVYVDKGMQHGQKITFTGEANANPGSVPGDVVVVLKQEEHDVFTRKESNLVIEKEISLSDALCGSEFYIKQLDGRMLFVRSPPGTVITPGTIKSIPGEGMPVWKNPMERGFMFVKFAVKFPISVTPSQSRTIQTVLGRRTPLPEIEEEEEVEDVEMVEFENDHMRSSRYANGSAYDEDDDEDGQPRVQCAQS